MFVFDPVPHVFLAFDGLLVGDGNAFETRDAGLGSKQYRCVCVCVSCTTGWQKVLVVHLSIMAVSAFEALSALGFFCVIPNGLQAGPCWVVS